MKDVVDDERRRIVDETHHAREELSVAGISLERVALDDWRSVIPTDGRAESAKPLRIVTECVADDRRRCSEQRDTASE